MSDETGSELAIIKKEKTELSTALELVISLRDLIMFQEPWDLAPRLKLNTYTNSDLTRLISEASKVSGVLELYSNSLNKLKELAVKDLVNGKLSENGRKEY